MKPSFSFSGVLLAIGALVAVILAQFFIPRLYPVMLESTRSLEVKGSAEFVAIVATVVLAGYASALPSRYPSQGGHRALSHLREFLQPTIVVAISAVALLAGIALLLRFNFDIPSHRLAAQLTLLSLNLGVLAYCIRIAAKTFGRFRSSNRMYAALRYIDSSANG